MTVMGRYKGVLVRCFTAAVILSVSCHFVRAQSAGKILPEPEYTQGTSNRVFADDIEMSGSHNKWYFISAGEETWVKSIVDAENSDFLWQYGSDDDTHYPLRDGWKYFYTIQYEGYDQTQIIQSSIQDNTAPGIHSLVVQNEDSVLFSGDGTAGSSTPIWVQFNMLECHVVVSDSSARYEYLENGAIRPGSRVMVRGAGIHEVKLFLKMADDEWGAPYTVQDFYTTDAGAGGQTITTSALFDVRGLDEGSGAGLPDGLYDFFIQCSDAAYSPDSYYEDWTVAGNETDAPSGQSGMVRLGIDTAIPMLSLKTPVPAYTNDNNIQIQFDAWDQLQNETASGLKAVTLTYDYEDPLTGDKQSGSVQLSHTQSENGEVITNNVIFNFQNNEGEGKYIFYINAIDRALNEAEPIIISTVFANRALPVTIVSPTRGLHWSACKTHTVQWQIDWHDGIPSKDLTVSWSDGETGTVHILPVTSQSDTLVSWDVDCDLHSQDIFLMVSAEDSAGNAGNERIRFVVDNSIPEVSILSPRNNATFMAGDVVTLEIDASDEENFTADEDLECMIRLQKDLNRHERTIKGEYSYASNPFQILLTDEDATTAGFLVVTLSDRAGNQASDSIRVKIIPGPLQFSAVVLSDPSEDPCPALSGYTNNDTVSVTLQDVENYPDLIHLNWQWTDMDDQVQTYSETLAYVTDEFLSPLPNQKAGSRVAYQVDCYLTNAIDTSATHDFSIIHDSVPPTIESARFTPEQDECVSNSGVPIVYDPEDIRFTVKAFDDELVSRYALVFNGDSLVTSISDPAATVIFDTSLAVRSDGQYQLKIRVIDGAGNTSGEEIRMVDVRDKAAFPDIVAYPNPFNPQQNEIISIRSNADDIKDVKIYDAFGNLVQVLKSRSSSCEFEWNGRNGQGNLVANGGYVCIVKPENTDPRIFKIAVKK